MQTFVTIFSVLMGSCSSLPPEFVHGPFNCHVHVEKVLEKGQGQREGQDKGEREQRKQF